MKVTIRVDASLQIGMGHVVRCITLANELRKQGAECLFVCREHPGNLLAQIRTQGFQTNALPMQMEQAASVIESGEKFLDHANWLGTHWSTDAEQTINSGAGKAASDWVIVDHYALDIRWERALRPHCRNLMAIDDLADRQHDCDLLLDQNLMADMAHRYDSKLPLHCGQLLGPSYALLQPGYADLHSKVGVRTGPIRRILVFFGGADTDNLTGMTIAAFLSLGHEDIALDVVVNTSSPHVQSLRQQVDGHDRIVLHEGLPSLAPLMVQADLAIGAGGTTSWERCCLGLPSLVVTLAANQIPIATELDRQGLVRWLGHKDVVNQTIMTKALRDILVTGPAPDVSERCRQLVDGQGTERVAKLLMIGAGTRVVARPVRLDDEELILRWANDPFVRQNSFSPEVIAPAAHNAWFHKRMDNPTRCRFYIVETDAGFPVGQVRFEKSGKSWEIHYAIDACLRGRGMGVTVLETALRAFKSAMTEPCAIVGRVKATNQPSRNIFIRLGFDEQRSDNELTYNLSNAH